MVFKVAIVLCLLASVFCVEARTKTSLNNGWAFNRADVTNASEKLFNDSSWQRINIPHTWNAQDAFDDEPGFYRGAGWYRRSLTISGAADGRRYFLYFEGANQVADVFVNGQKAGRHIGGYSAFSFDITELVVAGKNSIAVRVDNSFNENIPPLTADFTFYGGIYRDVWLISTSDLRFDVTDHASSGISVSTPRIAEGNGTVAVGGTIRNSSGRMREVVIRSAVYDSRGRLKADAKISLGIGGGSLVLFSNAAVVKDPSLWSPDSPYLYSVKNTIVENGRVVDEVIQPLGFRWFRFDADKGFFLNGKHLALRGTNRHQDFEGLGNALPDRLHVRDMQLIKDAGFNFVRLAHYPQDPAVLEACDRLGLVVWEETPLVNYITDSPEFTANSEVMVREMIRQHRNHPSVVMWGYMNEIFLRMPPGREDLYPKTVELARKLNRIAKEEDPTRPTTIAFHGNERYNLTGLGEIPDVIGWNLYQGWYSGDLEGFGKFIDDQHRRFPKRPLIISEYGANADRRLHSTEPRRFDSTIEYQRRYHESYLAQINARPFIAGSGIWNQFDFGSEYRGESIPHLNQKGMYYFDRTPKDVHYLYKAALSKEPVVHIAVRDQKIFAGENGREFIVDVYSNLAEVELILNGKSVGSIPTGGTSKASWKLGFSNGTNTLTARGTGSKRTIVDTAAITFKAIDVSSSQIAINVGSNADYLDANGVVWLADQAYKAGSWGYIGSNIVRTEGSQQDRNILSTNDEPLYQTFWTGIDKYKLDVPAGKYTVELYFAENRFEQPGKRTFDVSINSKLLLPDLDLARSPGAFRPFVKTVEVTTQGGIEISFSAKIDKPILNAIRVTRR